MKDMIDQRDFREKCARSIVKGYNVRYIPAERQTEIPKENTVSQGEENISSAKVFEADERYAKRPSSQYGTTSVEDPVTKEQIAQILDERNQTSLIEALQEQMTAQ